MTNPVSPLHDVPDSPHRRDQFAVVLGVDLLAQVVDDDVDDVRAGIEMIPPSILGDQGPAHYAALMAHGVLEDGVLFRRELDELTCALHLARVTVQLAVRDAKTR